MIKVLTSWRGIFALCIVCFHFGLHEFDQMTLAGVTFFFMTSGFLSAMNCSDKDIKSKPFYKRRLWRIFPLHWLALALMIILDVSLIHGFSYGWDLPFHIALLQSWSPYPEVHYNYSIHSWFLSSLLFCVLLTPLLVRCARKLSLTAMWIILVVIANILIPLDLSCESQWGYQLLNYTYVCPLTRVLDYSIGIALFTTINRLHWREKMQHISTINASLIELATLTVLAIFIVLHADGGTVLEKLEKAPLWWIPCALLITTATVLNNHEGILGKILTFKPLLWLGTLSFEIYILQKLVNNAFCYLVAPVFGHFGILIYHYSFAFTLPMLIVAAYLVNRYFTRPIARLAR